MPDAQFGSQRRGEFYHPYFRFKDPVYAVRVQLEEFRRGKPKEKIWDAIFAAGGGGDQEVPREETPVGGHLPLFREFCQPLAEDTRWELRVTDVTPNRKGKPTKSFDETVVLRPRGDLPRTYHLRKTGLPPPKKFSAEYWARKGRLARREAEAEKIMSDLAWPPRRPMRVKSDTPDGAVDFSSWRIDPETGKPVEDELVSQAA
ncbi:EF-hand domain-containing protein [Durusdinium trenchii]|uniref:EF-hand domain-containing protein n=1 Tax=Durusdinium trenchii TaxID=1381693 RepID=A0ABP0NEP1_9DINO